MAPRILRCGQFGYLASYLLTDTLYRLPASIPMDQRESRTCCSDRLSSTAASTAMSCPTHELIQHHHSVLFLAIQGERLH